MKNNIPSTRKFIRSIWPAMSLYLTEFMNEKRIAGGQYKGNPFSKKAWVEECEYSQKGYYRFIKTVSAATTNYLPRMDVEIRIYPKWRN